MRPAGDNGAMNWQKIALPIAGVVMVAAAYRGWGWGGVALVLGAILMWGLLHFTRMMTVLRRSADRPVGYVGSAVMLNAKLKPNVNLLHVMAFTRAIGEQLSPKDAQPEIFRWTDGTQSHVTCEFVNGRLKKWTLYRPPADAGPASETPAEATPPAP